MNRLLMICLLVVSQLSTQAFGEVINQQFEEDRLDQEQQKMVQERMEEEPSSTAVGGSRGGQLENERRRDDQRARDHELEKQEQLYEYEGQFRQGL